MKVTKTQLNITKKSQEVNPFQAGVASFLDLHLFVSNDILSIKIYDKRDNFYFQIVNFPMFLEYINSILDLYLSYARGFQNQNFMATWCLN